VDGIHDLGGREGHGPVALDDPDGPVFAEPWEGRAFGTTMVGLFALRVPTPAFRHAIERMDPAHYLASSYYEHWLTAAATLAVEAGAVTVAELPEGFPLARPALVSGAAVPDPQPGPVLAVGDRVRVRDEPFSGHTRCPAYVRGRAGVVVRVGPVGHVPEVEAHRWEKIREQTYTVRFDAADLWPGRGGHSVAVDLHQHDLEALTDER
jgi:nitrile hydratase beta subunit